MYYLKCTQKEIFITYNNFKCNVNKNITCLEILYNTSVDSYSLYVIEYSKDVDRINSCNKHSHFKILSGCI